MTASWTVDVIACRGSSYDVGRQFAAGFRKTPRGRAFKRRKERKPFGFSLKNAEAALTTHAPNIWEELHGLADGLEIPLDRAVAEFSNGRLRYPARGCSAVMTGGLYGRNYDFSPGRYDRILAAVKPDGVHASIGFTDRFTGRDDGMNEKGLCVGLHYVNEKVWQPGLVCVLIVRIVLDQCATTAEAVELLRRLPHGLCFNYSLLDATGHAAVVEGSPAGVAVRQGKALACTNHFQSTEMVRFNPRNPGSKARLGPLETWAQERPDRTALFGLLNASDSPVFAHAYARGGGTLHTFVCDPKTTEFRVGVGGDTDPVTLDVSVWARDDTPLPARLEGVLGGRTAPFDAKKRRLFPTESGSAGNGARIFTGANLAKAAFRDVGLKDATFDNVDLGGARFDDINFSGATITENCNFKGMTLAGVPVADLFAAYRAQKDRDGA